jgi:hypothetical protein
MKTDQTFKKDYSASFYLNVYLGDDFDNNITIPLLKEFLKLYPDLLICNDTVVGEPFIFNKSHFDAFDGTSFSLLMEKPE